MVGEKYRNLPPEAESPNPLLPNIFPRVVKKSPKICLKNAKLHVF